MTDKTADLVGPGIGNYEELETVLPDDYTSILDRRETQIALYAAKDYIEKHLCEETTARTRSTPRSCRPPRSGNGSRCASSG